MTNLLEVKRAMKARQPAFIREDSDRKEVINPKDIREELVSLNKLVVKDIYESKTVFLDILKNREINFRAKTVALNTGALLYLAKMAKSIPEGYTLALKHIESGKAWEHFKDFLNCIKLG